MKEKKDRFFAKMTALGLSLAYDNLRLKSGYSKTDPRDASFESHFSRSIKLNCPFVSAAMDTITESRMAIAMAKCGGLGIIHRAMTLEDQAFQVKKVKLHLNGRIEKPITVKVSDSIGSIEERRERRGYEFQSFPVVDDQGKLLGVLSQNDFDFNDSLDTKAGKIMTPIKELVTASPRTSRDAAYKLMRESRKKILPLIDKEGRLSGLYIFSDLKRLITGSSSLYNVDKNGQLQVGAAIGTGEIELERARLLTEAGVDVLVIDTAHGDSKNVYDTLRKLKRLYQIDIVAGNISEEASAKRLAKAGADGIKVGQGPGSICTTRIIAGIGNAQGSAVYDCAKAMREAGIPICADGGIRNSGDIAIALGLGAHSVMLGRMLAGTKETPGEILDGSIKRYRGMGSLGAMQASRAARERYRQGDISNQKLVPEGVEAVVPYQGEVAEIMFRQIGGLRSGMGYVGAKNLTELRKKADFNYFSEAGMIESRPHDVDVVKS